MKPIVIDHTRQPDEAEYVLRGEVSDARRHVERLERLLGKARRVLLNREKELAAFQADGSVPKRRGFVKEMERIADWAIRQATGRKHPPRGTA